MGMSKPSRKLVALEIITVDQDAQIDEVPLFSYESCDRMMMVSLRKLVVGVHTRSCSAGCVVSYFSAM